MTLIVLIIYWNYTLCFIDHTGYIYLSLHWNFIWIYFTVLLPIDIYLYDFYLTDLLDVLRMDLDILLYY